MPPASYVAVIFVGAAVHFGLRCSSISVLKYDLLLEEKLISHKKHMWAQRVTCWYAIALLLIPVILVCTPLQHVYIHTGIFVNYIYAQLVMVSVSYWTTKGSLDSMGNKVFYGLLLTSSLLFPILVITDCIAFEIHDSSKDDESVVPVPVWLLKTLDISWFICLAIMPKFLPNDVLIRRKVDIVRSQ